MRASAKRPTANRLSSSRDQYAQASNQVPSLVLSNEINPPEVFSNRDAKSQNNLRRNKKQQTNKARERLNLTGNVDLGRIVLKQNKQPRRKNASRRISKPTTSSTTTTTHHPNTISEVFQTNPHRHNHNDNRQQQQQKSNRKPSTTSTYPVTYPTPETSTTPRAYILQSSSTLAPSINSTRVLEKVMKHLRLFSPIKLTM